MKSNFLKSFFNSKEASAKGNFSIHSSLDLDDTDDIVEPDNILSKMTFSKLDNSKKANIFSLNDSMCSNSSFEVKSPQIPKFKNFSMPKKSPTKSPVSKQIPKCNTPKISNFRSINKAAFDIKFSSPRPSKNLYENASPMYMNRGGRKENNVRIVNKEANLKIQNLPCKSNQSSNMNSQIFNHPNNFQRSKSNFQKEYSQESKFENANKINASKNLNRNNQDEDNINLSELYEESSEIYVDEKEKTEFSFNINDKPEHVAINNKSQYDQTEETDEYSDDTQLKALHMKLKMEAERINKWKTEIETELSTKTKKVNDYEKIIESLRSSNLELQMRQENISINYQEEIETRSDMEKKIDNSRQISQLLKDKIEEMENIQTQRTKENEKLNIAQNGLLNIINSMFLDVKSMTNIQNKYKGNIKNKNEELLKLRSDLTVEREKVADFKTNIEELDLKNSKLDEDISYLNTEKNELSEMFNQTLKSKKELECKIEESNKLILSLNNQIEDNNKEIQDLKISIDGMNEQILKERDTNKNLQENLNQVKEDYEAQLIKKEEKISDNDLMISSLEKDIKNKEIIISENLNEIENMKSEFETKMKLKESSIDSLTTSVLDKERDIVTLNSQVNQITESNHVLEGNLEMSNAKIESVEKNNEILKLSNDDLRSELALKNENISDLELKLNALKISEDKHNLEFESLKESIQIKQKAFDDLKEEDENRLKEKDIEIKLLSDDITKLNNQMLELLETMKSKDKNIFEEKAKVENNSYSCTLLEKETIVLKAQLADQIAEFEKLSSKNNDLETNYQVQSNKLAQLENKLKSYDSSSKESTNKIVSLEAFVNELSNEKQKILKSREDLRKELMFTLEQCKNDYEIEEKKKNKEIENLKKQLDAQMNDNQLNLKKSKTQLQEVSGDLKSSKSEINKLEKSLNQVRNEKNKLSTEVIELSEAINEITDKSRQIEMQNKTLESSNVDYQNKTIEYVSQITKLRETLEHKEYELIKYKAKELEIIENNSSPPCTQLPESIKLSGSATPKSQRLSLKLNSLDSKEKITQKTPQKTPKSILRQPGSASKRRRVIFEEGKVEQNYMISDQESIVSDTIEIDFEGMNNKTKNKDTKSNVNLVMTPKRQNVSFKGLTDCKGSGKLSNIRKTPSKTPKSRTEKKAADKDNWFDNDNFFGIEV